jgi:hypothetical protein
MRGGSGCHRADSCRPSPTITGWSFTSFPLIPSRMPLFLRPSVRGTWGSSPTRSCGSISSRRSILLRRRVRRECGRWYTLGVVLSRCSRVRVSCTSRPSLSPRTAGGTMASSTYATTTASYLASLARSLCLRGRTRHMASSRKISQSCRRSSTC